MATFKIDDVEYDTIIWTQRKARGWLYQKSLQDEGSSNALEIARAARIELGRKLKDLVIDGGKKKG